MILSASDPAQARKCRRTRVYLDGIEVTHDCEIVVLDEPDEPGAVRLLKQNAEGRHYIDPETRQVAREWKQGRIVLRRRRSC